VNIQSGKKFKTENLFDDIILPYDTNSFEYLMFHDVHCLWSIAILNDLIASLEILLSICSSFLDSNAIVCLRDGKTTCKVLFNNRKSKNTI
jgi:hypothetical protein